MPRGVWGLGALLGVTLAVSAAANAAGHVPPGISSPTRPKQRFVAGEVIVRFKDGVDRNDRAAVLRSTDATRKRWLRLAGGELLRVPHGTSVEEAVRRLEADPHVRYAEPNFLVHAAQTPDDPRFGDLWALQQPGDHDIDAPRGVGRDHRRQRGEGRHRRHRCRL